MEKSFNEKVADNIKKYRKDADITLKELAFKVGITEATMQKYEAGNIKTVGTEMVIKIANALDATADELLCDSVNADTVLLLNEVNEKIKDLNSQQISSIAKIIDSVANEFKHTYKISNETWKNYSLFQS